MPDALEQAENLFLDASTRHSMNHLPVGDVTQLARAAALIAIAERMDEQNKSLELIASRLDDLSSVLWNVAGAGGAIKIDAGVDR